MTVRNISELLPRPDPAEVVAFFREVTSRPDLTLDDLLAGPLDQITEPGQYGPTVGTSDTPARIAAIADTLTTVSRVPLPVACEALRVLLDRIDPPDRGGAA